MTGHQAAELRRLFTPKAPGYVEPTICEMHGRPYIEGRGICPDCLTVVRIKSDRTNQWKKGASGNPAIHTIMKETVND